jgi:ficolin
MNCHIVAIVVLLAVCNKLFPASAAPAADSCSVIDPRVRQDCGYPGISRADCLKNASCCFDDTVWNVKWCFVDPTRICQNILVQQNVDGSSFFDRTWNEFKAGFGNTNGNYWLGNDQLRTLTQNNKYKLRMELQSKASGLWYWAEYDTFRVGDESTQYTLTISGFSGNVGKDAMDYHNGMKFTTKDRDNDLNYVNCAQERSGGFWYNACAYSCVNAAGDWFYWGHMSSSSDSYLRTSRMWLVCR